MFKVKNKTQETKTFLLIVFEMKNNFGGKLLKNYREHPDRNSKEMSRADRDQSVLWPPTCNKWGKKQYNPGE